MVTLYLYDGRTAPPAPRARGPSAPGTLRKRRSPPQNSAHQLRKVRSNAATRSRGRAQCGCRRPRSESPHLRSWRRSHPGSVRPTPAPQNVSARLGLQRGRDPAISIFSRISRSRWSWRWISTPSWWARTAPVWSTPGSGWRRARGIVAAPFGEQRVSSPRNGPGRPSVLPALGPAARVC
jgi:hypothetical protein